MHFLDRGRSDICFVVQFEADVERHKAESDISLNLYEKWDVG